MMNYKQHGADMTLQASPKAAQHAQGLSLRNFLASLTTSASVFAVEVCLFVILKDRLKQLYQPRTFLLSERQRISEAPSGLISWVLRVVQISDRMILQRCGLDAFFFLRYFQTLCKIFTSLLLIVVPSLVPLNSLGGNGAFGEVQGLDRLSWVNIRSNNTRFYWAHLVMALFVIAFVCHTIYEELLFYIEIRNCYLTSPGHRLLESASTVLVMDIPENELSALQDLYSMFPGGVRCVWINRDFSVLSRKIQEREKYVIALEAAETRLIKSATTSFLQRRNRKSALPERLSTKCERPLWERYLEENDRDHQYLPIYGWSWMSAIPFIGRRVDTIRYCLRELTRLNEEIEADQKELIEIDSTGGNSDKYPRMRSAFVRFNSQVAAHMACQTTLSSRPLHLSAGHVDVSVREVRWTCLSQPWWKRYARTGFVWIVALSLLVLWAIPVAFTGFLSQITSLADAVPGLHWINSAPAWLTGIVQGVLPQLALAVLTVLLPQVLRVVTGWQGLLTETAVELSLQKYYFTFLFVLNFLTVSLASSITAIAQDLLHGLDSAPRLVAKNLPKASNYFFSYLILQGLSVSAGVLLQAGGLVQWLIFAPLTDRTPRQKWERRMNLPQLQWGTCFPHYTNLACIGLAYSIIAPLILLISAITFGLFWFAFRYNLLYVSASPYDTGGRLYPTALKQLFMGIYMMELCLIGLFLSIRNDRDFLTGIGQAVIMIIATVATLAYQLLLERLFAPVLDHLPAFANMKRNQNGERRRSSGPLAVLYQALHRVCGWMMPAGKYSSTTMSATLQQSIYELAQTQFDVSDQFGYQHEIAHRRSPVVWIPKDCLGISDDEIAYIRDCVQHINISNELAELDMKGRITVSRKIKNISHL